MNTPEDTAGTLLSPPPCSALPHEAGFYWWRETSNHEWRMVHIVNLAPDGPPYLCAYDVDKRAFGGRTLAQWNRHEPIGQWVAVHKPNVERTHGARRDGI